MSAINAAKNELTSEILKRELAFILSTITDKDINHFYQNLDTKLEKNSLRCSMPLLNDFVAHCWFDSEMLLVSLNDFSKLYLRFTAEELVRGEKLPSHTIWFKRYPEQEEQYQAFKERFLAETQDQTNSWD